MSKAPVLECQGVSKSYGANALAEPVLRDISASLHRGEACALFRPSGSGKTTLLSVLGCLLTPTVGRVTVDGEVVDHGSGRMLGEVRRTSIGFVFHHAQLLPFLTMEGNLRIVGRNAGINAEELKMRIDDLVGRLGVDRLIRKRPEQASGGQRQRVAIARSLLHRPPILLADELTAALDWTNGLVVIKLLAEQARA